MEFYRQILISAGILLTIPACVHEKTDGCRTTQPVTVMVGEKNYANTSVTEGETPVNEDLPILSYVTPLEAWWHNTQSSSAQSANVPVTVSEKTHDIATKDKPNGTYELAVSGNRPLTGSTSSDYTVVLHPEGNEYNDIYIGYTTVNIPNYSTAALTMKRTKGKLAAQFSNLPNDVKSIEMKVDNVHSSIDKNMDYSGTTAVSKNFENIDTANPRLTMFLAPTPPNSTSPLSIKITHDNGDITTLSNINPVIERNMITLIKPTYVPSENDWIIEMNVDGQWKQIHELVIELL